jgi:hypothetical protein
MMRVHIWLSLLALLLSSHTGSVAFSISGSKTKATTTISTNRRTIQQKQIKVNASSSSAGETSKCPITKFGHNVENKLKVFDTAVMSRVIRIMNHLPAAATLGYFALVSMASMNMGPLCTSPSSLPCALTQQVGSTTNEVFAKLFPTLVTPASFVFLIWPVIALLQTITLSISALVPTSDEILSQTDLSALSLANLAATAWLIVSSNTTKTPPLASILILPLVPVFSGFSLRNSPKYVLWSNQIFSSFTTIATCLAFAIELQHGGRIPFVGTVPAEVAGVVFLSLYSTFSLAVQKKSGCKRLVNVFALTGILVKRVMDAMNTGGILKLLTSVTFLGSLGCWVWSFNELLPQASKV